MSVGEGPLKGSRVDHEDERAHVSVETSNYEVKRDGLPFPADGPRRSLLTDMVASCVEWALTWSGLCHNVRILRVMASESVISAARERGK